MGAWHVKSTVAPNSSTHLFFYEWPKSEVFLEPETQSAASKKKRKQPGTAARPGRSSPTQQSSRGEEARGRGQAGAWAGAGAAGRFPALRLGGGGGGGLVT
jgi:hypothetical protein